MGTTQTLGLETLNPLPPGKQLASHADPVGIYWELQHNNTAMLEWRKQDSSSLFLGIFLNDPSFTLLQSH